MTLRIKMHISSVIEDIGYIYNICFLSLSKSVKESDKVQQGM